MAINRAKFAAPAGIEAALAGNFWENSKHSESPFEEIG
jgi:hypothetical protein